MKTISTKKIRKKLEKQLDAKRFEHTLGVAYTAGALAMCTHADIDKALIAGLLHDCAKCMSNEKRISICKKENIPITKIEEKNPFLLHAKVGRYLAQKQFHIEDEDILNAILYHNTGRPDMSLLEKIIYVADYIEPRRNKASNLEKMRYLAFQDLDQTMYEILAGTLAYLKKKNANIDPMTRQAYEYFENKRANEVF